MKDTTSADSLRLVQINLKHSKCASENLLIFLNIKYIDVALIQEPWILRGKVMGLNSKDFELFYVVSDNRDYKPRSCILIRKTIKAFLFPNFSDGDTTTVSVEGVSRNLMLSSVYLCHDGSIPTAAMDSLVMANHVSILGMDANARSIQWGSKETNTRGESLFDYINYNNLWICNRGDSPTFEFPPSDIYPGWKEVLDVTLSSDTNLVKNWMVSDENSFSDHKYIRFDITFKLEYNNPFRNPRSTNWIKFKSIVYNKIKNLDIETDVDSVTNKITKAFDTAF